MHRNSALAGDHPGQQFRLVESALPLPPPVQRHRHDGIEALIARQGGRQEIRERPRQRLDRVVLEQVDQLAQRAFIGAEAIRRVKTAKAAAAQRAAAFGSSGKPFRNGVRQLTQKNSALSGCGSRRQLRQTGIRVNFPQRLAADAAIVGEEEGKKGVRG